MYLTDCVIENYGPIANLKVSTNFNQDNATPKPLVFVGRNGSGKTIFLSGILDAFYELSQNTYSDVQIPSGKAGGYKFLRLTSPAFSKDQKGSYISAINFEHNNSKVSCIESYNTDYNSFNTKHSNLFSINGMQPNGNGKRTTNLNDEKVKEIFNNEVFCYFPADRREKPFWQNNMFETQNSNIYPVASDELGKPLVCNETLSDISKWFEDILLFYNINDASIKYLYHITNTILSLIFSGNYHLAANQRKNNGSRKFRLADKENTTVLPSLEKMSLGQSSLFNIFLTILRYADINNLIIDTENIRGIVLIDEIDAHLHNEMLIYTLPKLMKMFPRVQFIVTTHSPLFLLGMNREYGEDGFDVVELPNGNIIKAEEFSEFQETFELYSKTRQFEFIKNDLIEKIKKEPTKTLIITEGKTDWKHLKKSFEKLDYNKDIEFLEYDENLKMGDTELLKICESLSKLDNSRKIICMFDQDNSKIIPKISDNGNFKFWGNNVYSFCIPIPDSRTNYKNISIEFYYSDEEVATKCENGCRLYFTNEINEMMTKNMTTNKVDKQYKKIKPRKEDEFDKKICDEDIETLKDDKGNALAFSKTYFANKIYGDEPPFNNFNFDNFKKITNVIDQILEHR